MSDIPHPSLLERNIKLYNIYKITTKRVFYPLIAVYLVSLGNVTLFQLGLMSSIASIVAFFTEIPAGYLADRYGAKRLVFCGALLSMSSAAVYLFDPNFLVGAVGVALFGVSMSLTSGAIQAFMYDTLHALGKRETYSKVMGYGQSYGLFGNVVLLSLIPLTYAIHPKLPFAIGVLVHGIGAWCIYNMVTPKNLEHHDHVPLKEIFSTVKKGTYGMSFSVLVSLAVIVGFISASFKSGVYRSILLTDLGIDPALLGLFVAGGSLVAAIAARKLHYFDRFNLMQIQIINALIVLITFVFVGLSYTPLIAVLTFIVYDVYMRNQSIIVEASVFRTFPNIKNKSTLLSVLKTSEYLFGFVTPVALAFLVTMMGIQVGHLMFGIGFMLVFYVIWYFTRKHFRST